LSKQDGCNRWTAAGERAKIHGLLLAAACNPLFAAFDMEKNIPQLRFGPYVTPVAIPGAVVECEVRGLVTIVGLSRAPIRWPIGERDGQCELVLYKALARAIRQEEPAAVAAAFGVALQTAEFWKTKCRRARRRKKQTLKSPPIPWKREDDELLCQVSLAEAARLTGRTFTAVRKRRRMLGLPDGRLARHKTFLASSLTERARAVSCLTRARMDQLASSLTMLHQTLGRSKATLAFWRAKVQRQQAVRKRSPTR